MRSSKHLDQATIDFTVTKAHLHANNSVKRQAVLLAEGALAKHAAIEARILTDLSLSMLIRP